MATEKLISLDQGNQNLYLSLDEYVPKILDIPPELFHEVRTAYSESSSSARAMS